MAQTKAGAIKLKKVMTDKYGADYYIKIGRMGGKAGTGHVYGHGKSDPIANGSKGGSLSRRGYKLTGFNEAGEPQYIKKAQNVSGG